MKTQQWTSIGTLAACLLIAGLADGQKIKDIARVEGVRTRPLTGVGLVTGLAGTGDSSRNMLTQKLYRAHLKNLGIDLEKMELKSKNVAVVMVTASVSSWTPLGSRFEVEVSSHGDAKSLVGGYLMETYLYGQPREAGDDNLSHPMAVAQGRIEISKDINTRGRSGATLESDLSFPIHAASLENFRIVLDNPDFSTASYIARAINLYPYFRSIAKDEFPLAHADRLGSLRVKVPQRFRERDKVIDFISRVMSDVPVEDLDPEALVVVDLKSGAISINGKVRVTPVVIVYSGLRIAIGIDEEVVPDGARPRDSMTFKPKILLLSQVMRDLEQSGIAPEDMPAIIKLINDSRSLIGRLVER